MNNNNSITNDLAALFADVRKYLETRYEIARLDVIEKLVIIASMLITVIALLLVGMSLMIYVSFSLAFFLNEYWNSDYLGFTVVGIAYIGIFLLLFLLRDYLITRPVLRVILRVIMRGSKETKSKNDDQENEE